MAKNRWASMVEVTTPDGRREYWAAAVPCYNAVGAVRKMIPTDHVAELSLFRLPSKLERLSPGEVRKVDVVAP
jgi:hypothetical protein